LKLGGTRNYLQPYAIRYIQSLLESGPWLWSYDVLKLGRRAMLEWWGGSLRGLARHAAI
jgi:hypothetical protein